MRRLVASLLLLCGGLVLARPAVCQEDSERDHGSRTTRAKKAAKFGTDYHLGTFGGHYMQDDTSGVMVDAGLSQALKKGGHKFELGADYLYDPFSTKTFNFPEEDQAVGTSRLVQPIHELSPEISWRAKWNKWWRSALELGGDVWWPELEQDQRHSFQPSAWIRLGKLRGAFGKLDLGGFYKKYPNYLVADRRIDQAGTRTGLEVGYRFGKLAELSTGYELEYTNYLDARYNMIDANGNVVRADDSKYYLTHSAFVRGELSPHKSLKLIAQYSFEFNDSFQYDRRMSGRNEVGSLVEKLIPDYYDYARHRVALRAKYQPFKPLTFKALAEFWLRDFLTYEARTEDNVWTGEFRHDTSWELGLEAAYQLFDFDAATYRHGVFVIATGSHLSRRSNMEREISLATNFDVTRVFLGLELKEL